MFMEKRIETDLRMAQERRDREIIAAQRQIADAETRIAGAATQFGTDVTNLLVSVADAAEVAIRATLPIAEMEGAVDGAVDGE